MQRRVRRDAAFWQWRLLRGYAKPTIAMVNGWCFGGAFTPLVACDLALRSGDPGNLTNPGTTADLTAAAIFVVLVVAGFSDFSDFSHRGHDAATR